MALNPQTKALPQPPADKLNEAALDMYRALEELTDYAHRQSGAEIPENAAWRIDDRALSRADTALAKARSQLKEEPKYEPKYDPNAAHGVTGATGATGAYDVTGAHGATGQHLRSPEDAASTLHGGNKVPARDDTSASDVRHPAHVPAEHKPKP